MNVKGGGGVFVRGGLNLFVFPDKRDNDQL